LTSPSRLIPSLLLGLLLAIFWQTASAEKVYKWVDDKGVTHYGQQPPAEKPASIEKVQIEQNKPGPSNNSRLKSTLDVANEHSRLERERLRLEQDKVNIEKKKAEQAEQRAAELEGNTSYTSPNHGPGYGRPIRPRPPLRPRPPQRPVRPTPLPSRR